MSEGHPWTISGEWRNWLHTFSPFVLTAGDTVDICYSGLEMPEVEVTRVFDHPVTIGQDRTVVCSPPEWPEWFGVALQVRREGGWRCIGVVVQKRPGEGAYREGRA